MPYTTPITGGQDRLEFGGFRYCDYKTNDDLLNLCVFLSAWALFKMFDLSPFYLSWYASIYWTEKALTFWKFQKMKPTRRIATPSRLAFMCSKSIKSRSLRPVDLVRRLRRLLNQ